jgi:hypothetical protein
MDLILGSFSDIFFYKPPDHEIITISAQVLPWIGKGMSGAGSAHLARRHDILSVVQAMNRNLWERIINLRGAWILIILLILERLGLYAAFFGNA